MFTLYFLKLLLAHLLVRFLIEPRIGKTLQPTQLTIRWLAAPGAKALLAGILLVPELHPRMLLSLTAFALIGFAIDTAERASARSSWAASLAAHGVYGVATAGIALWWSTGGDIALIGRTVAAPLSDVRVLWAVTLYFLTVFVGGVLVQSITGHFRQQFDQEQASNKPGLQDAGHYIGWLERFLIVTFLLGGYGEAIGFLLAGKAVVRYPEIKGDKGSNAEFAEYFLIGTLTSVGIGLLGGLALRWAVT